MLKTSLREAFEGVRNPTAPIIAALKRPAPKPRTKEQERGWAAKLSFRTHRKLVAQGFTVL